MTDRELLEELLERVKMIQRFVGCDDERLLREAALGRKQAGK